MKTQTTKLEKQTNKIKKSKDEKKEFEEFKAQREFKQELMKILSTQIENQKMTFIAFKEKKNRLQKNETCLTAL